MLWNIQDILKIFSRKQREQNRMILDLLGDFFKLNDKDISPEKKDALKLTIQNKINEYKKINEK